jgi:hypothetical protein
VPSFAALFPFRRALKEMRNTEKENAAHAGNGAAAEGTVLKSLSVCNLCMKYRCIIRIGACCSQKSEGTGVLKSLSVCLEKCTWMSQKCICMYTERAVLKSVSVYIQVKYISNVYVYNSYIYTYIYIYRRLRGVVGEVVRVDTYDSVSVDASIRGVMPM